MKKYSMLIFILALLNMLESLSIDLYLPAFPVMSKIFGTEIGNIQISISTFFAGFAIGQLLWGPLSDQKGRKSILYIGIIIFIIASVVIIFTKNVYILWIMRFVQAFGGSTGIVVGRAIVTDLFDKKNAMAIFSSQSQISGIAPIVAPLLGAVLLQIWGWESSFALISILGGISLLLIIKYIPETLSKTSLEKEKSQRSILISQFKTIFSNQQFLKNTLIGSIAFASLIIYISNSPFLFMEIHKLSSTQYSLIFAFNSLALILASYFIPKLLKRFSEKKILNFAICLLAFSNLAHLLLSNFSSSLILEISFLYLSIFSIGLLFPVTTAGALSPFSEGKGVASALFGFFQLILTFIISGIVGLVESDTSIPMISARLLLSLIALVVISIGYKRKKLVLES